MAMKHAVDNTAFVHNLCGEFQKHNHIDPAYYQNLDVKRGLRNADGTGARVNNFEIDNAVKADGTPAGLRHIDFVKIQTGVHFTTESIGELSTEVLGVKDLHAGK